MSHERRGFKGGAKPAALTGDINSTADVIPATDLSTWAGATSDGAGTATINEGQSDEEVIFFTGVTSNTLTGVTRHEAGTAAQSHAAGATLSHGTSVIDAQEANELVAAMANNNARVYRSTDQSITNNAFQAITFDSVRYDTGGLHSAGNPTRLTCQQAGKYNISGTVEIATSSVGERILEFRLNGTTVIAADTRMPSTANATRLSLSTSYQLAQGDYVEMLVYQSTGGFASVVAAPDYSPEFAMGWTGF